MSETWADTDVRDVIARATFKRIDEAAVWEFGGEPGHYKSVTEWDVADAVLAALAEAGLHEAKLNEVISGRAVVVPAEDVGELRNERDAFKAAMEMTAADAMDHRFCAMRENGLVQRAEKAEAALRAIGMVRTWRNEDGKSFVFTEDISAILHPGAALPATEEENR